ncbi:hypothetical protein [Luteibaculum oceani]|uniref:Right-handed parallel beta-helix repeat-containing protein n=1 Tax=Luteibaculum oceani TaxID=1294296 RepID=A0A5C6UWB5_9FLAO|nr:hypothetical protein [Luteibaculum oceani]TXC76944.1 hypothetical protein FRX97_10030 [Luteibaculum oceani]
MIKKSPLYFLFILLIIIAFSACKKEKFTANLSDLSFSIDTLFFDTVFTEIGTATRNFKVYNRGNKTIEITSVALENNNSVFRINADGTPGPVNKIIEIGGGDSIFVFVEANIDPNGVNSPLIVEDKLVFSTSTESKKLPIVAWGQDAHYIRPNTIIQGLPPLHILPENTTWTNEKPIVIYGYAVVDSLNSLTIQAGTQIHFHAGGGLWIYNGGNINANGTLEEPIVFQGDRLESFYDELPGQWDRIIINESDKDHVLKNCVIKNAFIGLQIETLQFPYNLEAPTSSNQITLENIVLKNHSLSGILARNYRIKAGNVAIYNCGQQAAAFLGGGEYQLSHFTIANYWAETVRNQPSLYISNAYQDILGRVQVRNMENSYMENSIVTGFEDTEIGIEKFEEGNLNFLLRHNQIDAEEEISKLPTQNIIYDNPVLEGDVSKGFKPTANSPVLGAGIPSNYPNDITGKLRPNNPDLGVFEID